MSSSESRNSVLEFAATFLRFVGVGAAEPGRELGNLDAARVIEGSRDTSCEEGRVG